ncbi:hypothetical protein FGB62_293g04 [Gracilaria domingensis]|nr:hypothetical protein FGB62_293g04 [Gracilaria domingensis]
MTLLFLSPPLPLRAPRTRAPPAAAAAAPPPPPPPPPRRARSCRSRRRRRRPCLPAAERAARPSAGGEARAQAAENRAVSNKLHGRQRAANHLRRVHRAGRRGGAAAAAAQPAAARADGRGGRGGGGAGDVGRRRAVAGRRAAEGRLAGAAVAPPRGAPRGGAHPGGAPAGAARAALHMPSALRALRGEAPAPSSRPRRRCVDTCAVAVAGTVAEIRAFGHARAASTTLRRRCAWAAAGRWCTGAWWPPTCCSRSTRARSTRWRWRLRAASSAWTRCCASLTAMCKAALL